MNNFSWIATWKITQRCNLYCVYCDHASMRPAGARELIDYEKALRTIAAYAPKILNISGGEPTLVETLPQIVANAKKQWNPFIRIVHNGTNPKKLIPCLPYIDRVVISLDGPDPINKRNRGISAQTVYNKLKEVLPEFARYGVQVYFNCVLSTLNVHAIRQLAQEAADLSPAITVSFTPIMPPDSDLSILSDEKTFGTFLAVYNDLKQQGFSVMQVFDGIRLHENYKKIQCYNQYFTIRATPKGQILTCAMNTALHAGQYRYYFGKLFSKNGVEKALTRIKKKVKQQLHTPPDFSCTTLCACENWLDLVFLGIPSDCISHYSKGLQGRLTETDFANVEAFVQKNINPNFKKEMLIKAIND